MNKNTEIFKNLRVLFLDRASRILFGFLVTAAMARYLGPVEFGNYSYALAAASVLGLASGLGLNTLLVQSLVTTKPTNSSIVGTAIALQSVAGAVCLLAVCVYLFRAQGDPSADWMLLLMCLSLPFRADVFRYWFEAGSKLRITAWIDQFAFLFSMVLRVLLIIFQQPAEYFAAVVLVETLVSSLLLIKVYLSDSLSPKRLTIRARAARALLRSSSPLLVSALAYAAYTRIDQVLVAKMSGAESAGVYALAVRVSEYLQFIPLAIVLTHFPQVLSARRNAFEFRWQLQHLLNQTAAVTMGLAILAGVSGFWVFPLTFGSAYAASAVCFAFLAPATIFFAFAIVTGRYLTALGLQKITMWRHLWGGVINVAMNVSLIPSFGAEGAAFSALVSFAFANYFYDAFAKQTRPLFVMKSKALCLAFFWQKRGDQ